MTDEGRLMINARWDRNLVPAGRSSQRNLLIEITAPPKPESVSERSPVNLSLVIDRSGSMRGGRIAAAREATTRIIDLLNERDRLSLVAFDNEIETLLRARAMNAAGKLEAIDLVEVLDSRGTTNLAAGWFEGARCAAEPLDRGDFSEGYVLVLSDGYANQGIRSPEELQRHAGELAERGIKTSALGIGQGYSPLQLDALAEGGGGRLHDAESMDDIIDVVCGELGELQTITARDIRLTIECPDDIKLDLLTRSSVEQDANRYSVKLGDLVGDSTRPIAIRAEIPAIQNTGWLPFRIKVDWRWSPAQKIPGRESLEAPLRVVPPSEASAQEGNREVIAQIASLWEAVLAYRAMRLNERHDFVGASHLYDTNLAAYEDLVSTLPDASDRIKRARSAHARVSQPWNGRSKREAYSRSKKAMLAERDLRRDKDDRWYDFFDK